MTKKRGMRLTETTPPVPTELDRLRLALAWYANQAKAVADHCGSKTGEQALIQTIRTLAEDGGRRADKVLHPQ